MTDGTDPELEALRKRRAEVLLGQLKEHEARKAWPSAPIELTDGNFKDIVARYPLLLIDFWAPWCGPCKMVGPILEQLARDYQGKVVFGKLNVDENPQIPSSFKVVSIPTLIIVRERELVERVTGAVQRGRLESLLMKHMGVQ